MYVSQHYDMRARQRQRQIMAADQHISKTSEAYPMKGGDDVHSYANNSYYQRGVIDTAKRLITNEIADKLYIKNIVLSNTFQIADLGCSVGPNTFFAVQNIIEAVQFKCQCEGIDPQLLEFQVFFNDHASNDFNTLFTSAPPKRQYYAAGVPGSFYSRLFPTDFLHFVHSSFAIHWLSRVPTSIVDKSSPAWNKGRIHYSNTEGEVVKAYEAQHAKDMECFLHARAQEVVCGGLIALIVYGRPNDALPSQIHASILHDVLGSCLMDMARKGIISEEKVDSFNVPIYYMSPEELVVAVTRNGEFSVERMEKLDCVAEISNLPNSQALASQTRAVLDGLIKEHFGDVILDQLFESFRKKIEEEFPLIKSGRYINFFALLKRKAKH